MKFLGDLELEEQQIICPSPSNPRLKGLLPEEPSIQALAGSIKKDGQLQRIIVQKVGSKYETIDGDRRCIAIFKSLKWKTILATAYEMTYHEALRLRLVANIQKEDLTPVEKGKYCYDLFVVIANEDKLNGDQAWSSRGSRSKYLAEISQEVGVTPGTIINWIRLWHSYPPEAQKLIASNKEDLRKDLIAPTTALEAAYVARKIKAPPYEVLRLTKENRWTNTELCAAIHRITDGESVTLENLPEVITKFRQGTTNRQCVFEVPSYQNFLKSSKSLKVRFDDYLNLAIQFVLTKNEEFKQFVISELGQGEGVR
jgi:ParB/RepB/Spo0J family partition protein